MKSHHAFSIIPQGILLGLLCALGAATSSAQGASSADPQDLAPEGFRNLISDDNLSGWWGAATEDPRKWQALTPEELALKMSASQADIHEHWKVVDGTLVNDGHGLFLTTEEEFEDFELRLEYKTVAGADSGVYLRGLPQVQIWDTTEAGGKWNIGAKLGSGGLWNNSANTPGKDPLVHADLPFGQWNAMRIIMLGERVSVYLNGKLVVEHARLENYFNRALPAPQRGPIQLQTHGGEIAWRRVFIHRIEDLEANRLLQARDNAGFESVFNGKDFSGWSGPTNNYVIEAGALRCKSDAGGTIYTAAEYGDFAVRMEFKLPPGGNNGLAIRYPGSGDTAYVGMCELQVLDDSADKYANLDERQFHGSVYGQAPAQRGYLRQAGSWNFQQVTVRGSQITVELNGTRILDRDISKIESYMYEAAKFEGRVRKRGHFGFAGHNDPVAFRAISIKELDTE